MLRIVRRIAHVLRYQGPMELAGLVLRLVPEYIHPPRCRCAALCGAAVEGRMGLEIGGPSRIFSGRGLIPAYGIAAGIDGANFAAKTVWADSLGEDHPYEFKGRRMGRQYLREGTDLHGIGPETYDFILSSHAIEHIANPLGALAEWRRVLRPGGTLVLVVPHKDATFDHRRPVTSLEHIEGDLAANTAEHDLTHLPEILALHDRTRDWGAGTPDEFRRRCEDNLATRCLHHHVFDTELAVRVVDRAGFRILAVEPVHSNNIVVVGAKPEAGGTVDNAGFLYAAAEWRMRSPFASDRVGAVHAAAAGT